MRAMNRRTFIATSIAAAVAGTRPAWSAETFHIDRVGLQLYTVRDLMKKDFDGTIAKVAQIGYKEVEFAGYYDRSPQAVRAILEKDGLTSPSTHVGYDIVEKKWSEALDAAHTIGHTFVVCPWIDAKQNAGWLEARSRIVQSRWGSGAKGRHPVRLPQSRVRVRAFRSAGRQAPL